MTAHATPVLSPSPVAWLSLVSALAAVVLLCTGNPYQLALPLALAATVLGGVRLRDGVAQAPAMLGLYLGILILFLWFALEVVAGGLLGIDLLVRPTVTTG